MRALFCLAAVLTLAACGSDGKPSHLIGAAIDGFQRGYGDGPQIQQQPINTTPLQAPPATMQPLAVQATFTGQSTQVRTVTGQMAWECQYQYGGQRFLLLMQGSCPFSVPVQ